MIVDTSAIIAILRNALAGSRCGDILARADVVRVSAATYLESAIVVDGGRIRVRSEQCDELIVAADMVIEPVTARHAERAREAYRTFGRGSGHPAKLNYGDCFSCALARESGESLLFVGEDFSQTDIRPAVEW